jgi:hypothetical protein
MTVKTKKCLVGFDTKKLRTKQSDFLAPVWKGNMPSFFGLKSGKFWDYGCVVYVGIDIKANDIFARLFDSGRKIPNVENTLAELDAYLSMVKSYSFGDILTIKAATDNPIGFILEKTSLKLKIGPKPNLP